MDISSEDSGKILKKIDQMNREQLRRFLKDLVIDFFKMPTDSDRADSTWYFLELLFKGEYDKER